MEEYWTEDEENDRKKRLIVGREGLRKRRIVRGENA